MQRDESIIEKINILSQIKPFLKREMLNKLDEHARWTYVSIPEGAKKHEVIHAMRF